MKENEIDTQDPNMNRRKRTMKSKLEETTERGVCRVGRNKAGPVSTRTVFPGAGSGAVADWMYFTVNTIHILRTLGVHQLHSTNEIVEYSQSILYDVHTDHSCLLQMWFSEDCRSRLFRTKTISQCTEYFKLHTFPTVKMGTST